VKISLNKIANRTDRGFNFEVRIEPPKPLPQDAKEATEVKQAVQTIQVASANMQYIKLEGPPTQVGPSRFLLATLNVLPRGFGDPLARRGSGKTGRRSSVQRSNAFEGLAVLHSDQGSVSNSDIFADLDWRALAAAARAEVVGRSFNRNRAMVLRELHIDERKFAVTFVDARDESVMGHIRFSSASLKDSCLNARGKSKAGNSAGNS